MGKRFLGKELKDNEKMCNFWGIFGAWERKYRVCEENERKVIKNALGPKNIQKGKKRKINVHRSKVKLSGSKKLFPLIILTVRLCSVLTVTLMLIT